MINWKVRLKNKLFWITLIPAVIVLIQTAARIFGIDIDLSILGDQLVEVIDAVFVILTIVGVVVDPTTKGLSDSEQALTYVAPKE